MSCCRGKRKTVSGGPAECKALENGGAATLVQVLSTAQGPRLVVATPRAGYLDLGSFLSVYKCDGPTARLLRRYLSVIQQAFALDPAVFSAHRAGTNITTLIRSAELVVKRKKQDAANQSKVPPVTPS